MKRNVRDNVVTHIADPAACASMTGAATAVAVGDVTNVQNTGWGATNEADADKIWACCDALVLDVAELIVDAGALKTAIDANNAAIDAILVAMEKAGIVAKA